MFNNILALFGIVLGLYTASVEATVPPTAQEAAYLPIKNILVNPGFENGSTRWSASGGTFTVTTTNPIEGARSALWDSNAASQTFTSTAVAIPVGLRGRPFLASCRITVSSGTSTHTITLDDGTTNIVSAVTITNDLTGGTRTFVTDGSFPTSGNIRMKISSVASNEPEIKIDSCQILAKDDYPSSSSFSNSPLQIRWATTNSCSWRTTSTTFASFAADTDCPTPTTIGDVTAPGTKLLNGTFNNVGPGYYEVKFSGTLQTESEGCSWQLYDGTNEIASSSMTASNPTAVDGQYVGGVVYWSTTANRTIEVRARNVNTGTSGCRVDAQYSSAQITVIPLSL